MTAEYFAVPHPSDAARMTYWRRGARGNLKPWPARARYGPELRRSDVPTGLGPADLREWAAAWYRQHAVPWHAAVRAAIDADPDTAAARFAAFATRCCSCGRRLTDSASKTYGIGPECRADLPAAVLAAYAEAVGRAHADHEAQIGATP